MKSPNYGHMLTVLIFVAFLVGSQLRLFEDVGILISKLNDVSFNRGD